MNYHLRKSDELFLRVLTARDGGGVRAGLISGAPGVGKTALGRYFADHLGGGVEYYLCHHWSSDEDLFVRIDPARVAALAGGIAGVKMEDAYRAGVLLRAVNKSHTQPVVCLIDELDKAPERVDALLLEFLQTGRVYGAFGEVWEANLENLYVIITDNGIRPIAEPLLRRVFRYHMPYLPPNVEADIIRKQSGAGAGVCRLIVSMATAIRERGASSPSLQESVRLAQSLPLAESASDVEMLLRGWLCKSDADWDVLVEMCDQPHAVLWGGDAPMRGDAPMIRLRFSPAAWKKFHAALNTGARRQVPALVEEYFRARGWTVVEFNPVYVGLSPYRVGRLEMLLRPHGDKPWNEQPVYAVVCRYSDDGDGIVACVYLAELPRNAEQPKPLAPVAQSLVKRLSNVLRSLPVEHLNEEGSRTGAGACAEMPLNPHGSGYESGSRQNAPSESPTGDSDGADSPPPQDGFPDAICANKVARATVVGCNNPAGSGSEVAHQAAADAAERAEPHTDADDAAQDAPPFCTEATSGDALSNLPEAAEEAPRESSTVPSAGVAHAESAAVRQSRRNLLRDYARRTRQPSTQARRAFGGQFATIENKRPDPRLVRELRRIFAQIMHDGETEPSAHWNTARVALKTAGYLRSWTTHDRRLESGRPAMLVLADVSGSMNAFAEAVVALASAAAQLGVSDADVVVVVHTNGYPLELQVNTQPLQRVPCLDDDAVLRFYQQLLRRYAIRAVITAADWDGEWLYRWLAEQPHIERVFWLDVYCSTYGDPRVREFPPKWMDENDATIWRPVAHKVRYADRCSTAHDFVGALRLMLRQRPLAT